MRFPETLKAIFKPYETGVNRERREAAVRAEEERRERDYTERLAIADEIWTEDEPLRIAAQQRELLRQQEAEAKRKAAERERRKDYDKVHQLVLALCQRTDLVDERYTNKIAITPDILRFFYDKDSGAVDSKRCGRSANAKMMYIDITAPRTTENGGHVEIEWYRQLTDKFFSIDLSPWGGTVQRPNKSTIRAFARGNIYCRGCKVDPYIWRNGDEIYSEVVGELEDQLRILAGNPAEKQK
jgi:hypothetical protein